MGRIRLEDITECRICKATLPEVAPTDPHRALCDMLGFCSGACKDEYTAIRKREEARRWQEEDDRRRKERLERDFYNSREWIRLRYQALEKYGNTCLACGRGPRAGVIIHVDHIKPRSRYPDLALDINNLQVLCEACNVGKSNVGERDWRVGA